MLLTRPYPRLAIFIVCYVVFAGEGLGMWCKYASSPLLGGCYDYDNTNIALTRYVEWVYLPIAFSYSALYN